MWSVEIRSLRGDVEAIGEVLSRAGYNLREVRDPTATHLLCHPKYADFEDSNNVWQDASGIAQTLHRFSELSQAIELGLDLGSIRKTQADGSFSRHHFLEGHVSSSLSVSSTLTVERNPEISEEERERQSQEAKAAEDTRRRNAMIKRASYALVEPTMLKLMELVQIPHPSGTQLGHIVDLVRDACGGDLSRFANSTELTTFKRSINNPKVLGMEARHVVSNVDVPRRQMTLAEATSFARQLAFAWLEQIEDET